MSSYSGASNRTGPHNSLRVVFLLVFVWAVELRSWPQPADSSVNSSLGNLKVISVRKMTADEYARRIKDYIGATHVVRLRFEAPTDRNVFLYAPYCGKPAGYVLEQTAGKVRWLAANPGEDPSKSPGFKRVEVEVGSCWLLMTAGAAYEWEVETEPRAPTEEARSIFVRETKTQQPVEVISAWYTVTKESQTSGTTH